jgi:hypothetical protein
MRRNFLDVVFGNNVGQRIKLATDVAMTFGQMNLQKWAFLPDITRHAVLVPACGFEALGDRWPWPRRLAVSSISTRTVGMDLKGRSQRDGDQDHYTPREHGQPGDNGHRLADWQALLGLG